MPLGPEPTTPAPDPHASVPSFVPPPNSCDSHCHVFGPAATFPFAENRTFTPHDVPKEALGRLHEHLGLDRAVIVQSACHGNDHRALVDALRAGKGRYRGVALLPASASHGDVARLHEDGVRGLRLQLMPHLGAAPSDETVRELAALVTPFGWHLEVHVAGSGIADRFATFAGLDAPVVVDHLARVDLREGLGGPGVVALRRLLDTGHVWLKLSGVDRVSLTGPPYDDGVELAALLGAEAPERVLWGTDFPHPNISGPMPDDGVLLDLIPRMVPDENRRHQLLVDNPASLFGFGS